MFKAHVVIGAGYGDEGKGMWTDYLVRTNNNCLVVRANGGAQVGHTVVRNGERRVFSHLGSGTLQGAPTLYSKFSVVSPLVFFKEVDGRNADIPFTVFVDGDTPVTTPYDMLLNHVLETERGDKRHGSTGIGFGATLERMEDGVSLLYRDLSGDKDILVKKLDKIRFWCWSKMSCSSLSDSVYSILNSGHDSFIEVCERFLKTTHRWHGRFEDFDNVVFENGQGLLLDQEYGNFPYVTRSNTGFRNVGKILKNLKIFGKIDLDVYYLSRCYTTKHGAGPLKYEMDKIEGINFEDQTNVPNEFQGSIRLAPINYFELNKALMWDSQSHPDNAVVYKVATCCDQIDKNSNQMYINEEGYLRSNVFYEHFMWKLNYEFNNRTVWSPEGPN